MVFITEMTQEDFVDELEQSLMPAFRARYDLVAQIDPNFFVSETGKIELMSMALISNRIRKHKQNAMTLMDIDHAYSTETSGDLFYKESPHLISHAHLANFPREYDDINPRMMHLFDLFAKDLGLDPLYAHFDKPAFVQPPYTANGIIRSFDDFKHSALLTANIPAYDDGDYVVGEQEIPFETIDEFCNIERERFLRKMEERNRKREEDRMINNMYFKRSLTSR